jgi:hypothetical protein
MPRIACVIVIAAAATITATAEAREFITRIVGSSKLAQTSNPDTSDISFHTPPNQRAAGQGHRH